MSEMWLFLDLQVKFMKSIAKSNFM